MSRNQEQYEVVKIRIKSMGTVGDFDYKLNLNGNTLFQS